MSLDIGALAELSALSRHAAPSAGDDGFKEAVENALNERCPVGISDTVLTGGAAYISGKIQRQMKGDPSLAEEITQKIREMMTSFGERRDNIIIVDRSGEVSQYDLKPDRKKDYPSREELREMEKAQLRRKAKLDAYFKIVQQNSIKRKLIEEANVRRPRSRLYRCSGTVFDSLARGILQKPNRTNEFYF